MDNSLINQSPLFNLTHCEFFGLSLKADNFEWDKFIEDMLLIKYYSFRMGHRYSDKDTMIYFLHLLEGKFIALKCDIVLNLIYKMKLSLENNSSNSLEKDYIYFVNISRVIIFYLIQFLCNRNIRLNIEQILKFIKMDNELDNEEPGIGDKIVKYDVIKKKIETDKKLNMQTMLSIFPVANSKECIVF